MLEYLCTSFIEISFKFQFNSSGTVSDETEEKVLALEMACKFLIRINSGFNKVKQINAKCDDFDDVTADRFLQYLLIDEMKENDHNIQVAGSKPFSITLYERGYVGYAFVSHLIDPVRGLCCIIDCEAMPILKSLFNQQLQPLEQIPEPREKFAYLYKDTILFRAIRCDEFAPYTEGKFEILLIDIGCKIKVDINKSKRQFFVLCHTAKSISSYMRKCQIVNMPCDLNTLDLLHARIQYKIIFNDGKTVYINVLAENAHDFYGNQPDDQQNFYSYLWADSVQLSSLKTCEMRNTSPATVSENIFLPETAKNVESIEQNILETRETMPATTSKSVESDVDEARVMKLATTTEFSASKNKVAEITDKSISEPAVNSRKQNGTRVSTVRKTRGEIAKMLYNLKDDDVKWLDKKLPHQISEGTMEVDQTPKQQSSKERLRASHEKLMKILKSSNIPSIGKQMMIQATNVLDATEFYGYNVDDVQRYEKFFECFCSDSLGKVDFQLQVTDKVLAKYENDIYRAVVTQIFDKNLFQVFYLDFAHYDKLTSENIFKWHPSMDELPWRVLRFRINLIHPLFENDVCGVHGAQQILLASPVAATVVDVCDDDDGFTTIVIDAFDENNVNIVTTLTKKDFAVLD